MSFKTIIKENIDKDFVYSKIKTLGKIQNKNNFQKKKNNFYIKIN